KVLDAGDIMQVLVGWTAIGQGSIPVPTGFKLPFFKSKDFLEKSSGMDKGLKALEKAIEDLSVKCNPVDAKRSLYLLAAPSEEIGLDLFAIVGNALRKMTPDSIM